MLCDDSPTARTAMGRVLEADPQVRVVARAGDGRQALEMLGALPAAERPDVMLLDLEMPVMDGMTVLPLLLKAQPRLAVIVASALTQKGAEASMAAMRAGAADYLPKPTAAGGGVRDPGFQAELLAKVKGWARMRAPAAPAPAPFRIAPRPVAAAAPGLAPRPGMVPRPKVIAVGSSTGGPQALAAFVRALGVPPVPVVMVQHMPAGFTAMLADHLSRLGGAPAAEAQEGETLKPGRIYLAPGDRHLLIEASGGALVARLTSGPPENFCRPAVDPMLRSLVAACEGRITAVILTGMGSDGMLGCKAVAAAGGTVLAQDEASSVVWGMPGAVAKAGLAQLLLPPDQLAERVMAQFKAMGGAA
ncbi:chemotaxis-specific protein-glutamate methyltransferase CheB [Roseomonas sp. 573]|uniref:Protein-glutamate methylesterase/protein-glutamine glutaminase n=2 Tax=Roseomonas haemaphysalidis TaxID=2768162 RepID=A0ABS3KKD3_9PROT|nr:chemotaxis-specific protein-glutamate methyltransferase CheB [Roseomonas haemaphysalidis]